MPAWRWHGYALQLTIAFPHARGREPYGQPAALRSIPAPSIIPGRAEMLFQIRDDNPDVVERLEDLLRQIAAAIGDLSGCSVEVTRLRTGKPAMMNANFQHVIEQAASIFAGAKSIRMPSGAGHDAQVLATIMPAGMLFVPSIGGISHHWNENTDDADIVTGAEVFVETCRRLLAI